MNVTINEPAEAPADQFEPVDFTVVDSNIIVEFGEKPEEEVSAGGVILPGNRAQARESSAIVVGVGPHAHVDVDVSASQTGRIEIGMELVLHRHKLVKLVLPDAGERQLWVALPEHIIGIVG